MYTPGCGDWHTFYPGFLLYFDTGHIACVRRASLFWSGACFLLFLPSFPLVLTGCIAAFTSTCPSGWRWVGVWMFGGMWLLLLPEVFLLSVSVSWVFFRCQFYQYFLFGLLGVWYVLSASRGIYFLRFTGCWWHSYLPFILVAVCRCDDPLLVILTFFAWWFYLSRDLVPCYFGGLVVGALDIFWLDWTLCSFEVLPSR